MSNTQVVDHEEQAREQREREKVEQERDIMRDPHETKAKVSAKKSGANPMPKFNDNELPGKSVSALRIKEIVTDLKDARKSSLHFMEPGFGAVNVDAPWITANNPRPGGWYVVDATGRRFMNHQDFEKRYRKG